MKPLMIILAFIIALSTPNTVSAVDFDEQFYSGNDILFYGVDAEDASSGSCTETGLGLGGDLSNVPDPWRSLIESTASEYPQADKRLVAATLWIENRGWPAYDKDWAVSSASAEGPWQFIPSTWEHMGTDGDGDGKKDPNNPKDAVHAAFKHQIGSAGKPIIEGYDNDPKAGLSLLFKRDHENLLSFLANYNGSGAPDNTALEDFPRGQNADYVLFGYHLLTSNFTRTWDESSPGSTKSISAGGLDGSSSLDDCTSSEFGVVSSEGFSFPLGLSKSKITYLPCGKYTCHHDGTPASDMFAPIGTAVFAIEDGTIYTVKDGYDGYPGCYSINFTGSSGWKYWYGHIKSPVVSAGQKVKAGQKIAVVAEERCAKDTPPHLHIDRGGPEKGTPGGYDGQRSPTLIPLLDKLFEELPG